MTRSQAKTPASCMPAGSGRAGARRSGKSTGPKRQRVLKDALEGIGKTAWKRLARRAGALPLRCGPSRRSRSAAGHLRSHVP